MPSFLRVDRHTHTHTPTATPPHPVCVFCCWSKACVVVVSVAQALGQFVLQESCPSTGLLFRHLILLPFHYAISIFHKAICFIFSYDFIFLSLIVQFEEYGSLSCVFLFYYMTHVIWDFCLALATNPFEHP